MRRDQQDYATHARRLAERLSEPFDAEETPVGVFFGDDEEEG